MKKKKKKIEQDLVSEIWFLRKPDLLLVVTILYSFLISHLVPPHLSHELGIKKKNIFNILVSKV